MAANVKNMGSWHGALCALVGASALLAGCAADEPTQNGDENDLREGSFAVTSLDLGSCANDTWVKGATTTPTISVEVQGEEYVVKSCTDGGQCTPMSPARFAWNVDRWEGADGGAYLVESGCLLVALEATLRLDGSDLVIETKSWSAELANGSCTYDEIVAMRAGACATRTRLQATEQ
jgi:hypothetical protein